MPRSSNYYDSYVQNGGAAGSAIPVAQPQVQPDIQVQPTPPPGPKDILHNQQNIDEINRATNRGFWSFFGEGLREVFTGPQENWDNMSAGDKSRAFVTGTAKLGWNTAKAIPANIIKAPVQVGYSILEGVDSASQKVLGTQPFVPEKIDLTGIVGDNWAGHYLGDITGFKQPYKEAKQMAGEGGWGTFLAAVATTGKVAGDVAISADLLATVKGAFKPRLVEKGGKVMAEDFRPLQPDQLSQIKMKVAEMTGGKYKPTISFDQNPTSSFFQLPDSAAARYGGKSSDTFLKVSPAGDGMAEFSVVQLRDSALAKGVDWMKAKFGKSNVLETEIGPVIKVDSGLIKYDPGVITANGDMLPDFLKTSGAAELTPEIAQQAMKVATTRAGVDAITKNQVPEFLQPATSPQGVEPVYPKDIKQATKLEMANKGAVEELGVQYPSPVNRPLQGLADAPITQKQIGQINFMQTQREIDTPMLQAITSVLTGKNNIADLTQKEAFEVSETIRLFNKKAAELPGERDMFLRPFINPARYWMETAERKLGYPIYSQAYIPVETGARLAKVMQQELGNEVRNVFEVKDPKTGKVITNYADPTKHLEERRLITSYIEGDTGVITNNSSLSPSTKADLIKIGDWLKNQFQNFFEAAGIKSDRFFGQYAPKIRQLGTIANLYKNTDLPAELRPFFTFERGGMDQPIEDDALVLYDIYSRAFSRDKFLRSAVEQTKDLVGKLPEGLAKSTNDYLQEKLGYQGKPEMALNRWGMKLSAKTDGAIPADIFRKAINFLMTNSYAATLGIPRVVPIFANLMQSFLMSYPELGGKYFAEGWKQFFKKGALEEFNKSGFSREKGQIFGGELASQAAQGKVGKAFDAYQNVQQLSLVPFGKTDVLNAGVTYFGVKQRFQDFWQAFRDGKISYQDFEKGIGMDGFNPTLQGILREKFQKNTPETLKEAQDLMEQDILDSTQFPYRKAAESRAFYGLKGKFGLQYGIWPFEYAHTIKSWIARKQYGKLIRWYAMASLLDRSAKDALGVDLSHYLLFGPLAAVPMGPLANAAFEFTKAISASFQDLTDEADQHYQEVYDALKNYGGLPVGVGAQRVEHFYKSVNRYKEGIAVSTDPDPQKKFGIYSSTGKLKQWVNFGDLLKYTFGFTNEETVSQNDKLNAIRKDTLKYNAQVNEAMNALVDGNFKKFDKIVVDNKLQMGDISAKLQSFQIPLDQRLFDKMPAQLKEKYLPLFYPAQ